MSQSSRRPEVRTTDAATVESLSELSPDAVLVVDQAGVIRQVNDEPTGSRFEIRLPTP